MLTQNLAPPAVSNKNMRTFLDTFGRYVATGEIVDVERARDAQALDDAEFAPVTPIGYTRCGVCSRTLSDTARLACGSCAA